ncbi:hypothetical protein [Pseudomonas sp. KU43P]|uniref:hypothetical protein n=1 Tax=Pseudomonas sp. KU43P TaxID=2487887 RepID=UPI0012A8D53E|nr:hypothetical protein [Pseudomonas sp. KU43P]BBH48755.1 hypothetical protein KU43P_52320 [Pseudomonas sp. KU43P]
MTIESKDWYAQNNTMPGDQFFRVYGKVTVNHPGIEPVLVPYEGPQFLDLAMRLTLKLVEHEGIFPAVVCEKNVSFSAEALTQNVPFVEIRHEGKRLISMQVQQTC